MASVPFIQQAHERKSSSAAPLWRAAAIGERLAAAALFLLMLPVLALSALAVCLLSRRRPLIAHRRVGWRGADAVDDQAPHHVGGRGARRRRRFGWIEYIEDHDGPERKQSADPRVTNAFARFCRRHSIDELPQLWHVIRGEMSLVGPRPVTATEMRRYYGADADEILAVKPGLAGLWQVSGRNRLTYAERRALDLDLVRRRSLRLYAEILLRTVPEVLSGENSW